MPKILESPRERILCEARKMIVDKGYKNLSMRELAKNSSIGLGTVYNYFVNKESIVREIIRDDWKYMIKELSNTNSKDILFVDKMRIIYKRLERYFEAHVDIFFELYKEKDNGFSRDGCHRNILEDVCDIVSSIIEYHLNNKTLEVDLESKTLSKFIVSNMVVIIKSKGYTFEDLMKVVIKN